MTYNPRLKVFSANGYFDFATPFFATEYALTISISRPPIQRNITYGFYQSGHMVYLQPQALARFHADLERWYARVLQQCVIAILAVAGRRARSRLRRQAPPSPRADAGGRHARRRDEAHDRARRQDVIPTPRARARSRWKTTKGQPTCRMFYTAFTVDGADPSTRPVTFFYNGGPGSSTIWLRMGSFGPMRVQVGDARRHAERAVRLVADNQYSLLDRTRPRVRGRARHGLQPHRRRWQSRAISSAWIPTSSAFGQFVSRYLSDVRALELAEVSLRRIVRNAALGDARELPPAAGHRHQRRRAALVGPRLWLGLGHRTSRRRRSAAAIGRFRSTCRPRPPPRGITTAAGSARRRWRRSCRKSKTSRWTST